MKICWIFGFKLSLWVMIKLVLGMFRVDVVVIIMCVMLERGWFYFCIVFIVVLIVIFGIILFVMLSCVVKFLLE